MTAKTRHPSCTSDALTGSPEALSALAAAKAHAAPIQRNVTRGMQGDIYRAAFDQVCNPFDWKAPVDATVPYDLANLYMQAIEFMTGVKPDGHRCENGIEYHLTCVGYRNGPCGG